MYPRQATIKGLLVARSGSILAMTLLYQAAFPKKLFLYQSSCVYGLCHQGRPTLLLQYHLVPVQKKDNCQGPAWQLVLGQLRLRLAYQFFYFSKHR